VGDEAHFDEVIASFEDLVHAGKIRACGVCNFGPGHLARLPRHSPHWRFYQLPYNLLWRAIEAEILALCRARDLGVLAYSPLQQGLLTDRFRSPTEVPPGRARSRHFAPSRGPARHGGPGFEEETFASLAGIRTIATRLGRPMAQVAIAWLRARPGVTSLLVGARTPDQVAENAAALDLTLDAATLAELDQVTRPLQDLLGPDPDMWAATSRYR
jgi:aryl-alcohol dehydrogenase-like predicted oxidoreductase